MPLPKKAVYTIPEAAQLLASASGERVTQSQIIDWGKQGLYSLYMRAYDCHAKYEDSSEVVDISGTLVQLHLNDTQTATLESGYTIQIERGRHEGRQVIFMKSPTQLQYARWPEEKLAEFNCTSVALLGTELDTFIESLRQAPAAVQSDLSEPERDKLLRQIGGLAMALAEKHGTYRRGDVPNANQIAKTVDEIFELLPDASTFGAGDTSLRTSIAKGLKLLRK